MSRDDCANNIRARHFGPFMNLLLAFVFAFGIVTGLHSENSEPDDLIEDPQCLFIGIEFGAAYSRVGVYVNNTIYVVPNEHNEFATPNYVALTDEGWLVGEDAKAQVDDNESRTFFDMRRFLGRQPSSPEYQAEMQDYPFTRYHNGEGGFDIESFNPNTANYEVIIYYFEDITAELLKSLKKSAEIVLDDRVDFAVLSIPASFDDRQHQMLKDAANIAGLTVLRFVKEPVAAAMAYELDKPDENHPKTVNVIHAEQEFYHVTILDTEGGVLEILNTSSHVFGAKSWQYTQEIYTRSPRAIDILTSLVSKMKSMKMIDFDDLGDFIISRCPPPALQQFFDIIFGKRDSKTPFPIDETFVRGLTVHAKQLWDDGHGSFQDDGLFILDHDSSLEVTPMSIGVRLSNGTFLPTIPSGTGIPTRQTCLFESSMLSQRAIAVHVYGGERLLAKRNKHLGTIVLGRMGRFTEKMLLAVTFTIHPETHLSVEAEEIPPTTPPRISSLEDLPDTRNNCLASTWTVERMLAGKTVPGQVLSIHLAGEAVFVEEEREKMFAEEEVEMQWRKEDTCVLDRMRERGAIDEFGVELAELSMSKETL